jgi:hypothetical protein
MYSRSTGWVPQSRQKFESSYKHRSVHKTIWYPTASFSLSLSSARSQPLKTQLLLFVLLSARASSRPSHLAPRRSSIVEALPVFHNVSSRSSSPPLQSPHISRPLPFSSHPVGQHGWQGGSRFHLFPSPDRYLHWPKDQDQVTPIQDRDHTHTPRSLVSPSRQSSIIPSQALLRACPGHVAA